MSAASAPPLGVITLGGALPLSLVAALNEQGRNFHCIYFEGVTNGALLAQPHTRVSFFKIGAMVEALRHAGCREIVLAGQFFRPNFLKMRFDWGTLRYLPLLITARGHGDDGVLRRVTRAFEGEGFEVVSLKEIAPALVACEGQFGLHALPEKYGDDIALGLAALKYLGGFDIGQALVVDKGRVIALEAAEGTDAMLRRVRDLRGTALYPAPKRSGILIKAAKPQQQLRNDMPVIGLGTVENAVAAGLKGIVVESGRVITADLPEMVALANKEGLAIAGIATGAP